jgi:hypothetical protein
MKRKLIWDEELMLKSKQLLEAFKVQGLDLVLIGGWAVYFLTRYHMSRDIDFLMRDREIWKLRTYIQANGGREKAAGLRKIGFEIDKVGIDVYTETQSGFPVDIGRVFERGLFVTVEGYKVLEPGRLLRLKLDAARSRDKSPKGLKDRCDILSICLKDTSYVQGYKDVVLQDNDHDALKDLRSLIKEADIEFEYVLGEKASPGKVKRMKGRILEALE